MIIFYFILIIIIIISYYYYLFLYFFFSSSSQLLIFRFFFLSLYFFSIILEGGRVVVDSSSIAAAHIFIISITRSACMYVCMNNCEHFHIKNSNTNYYRLCNYSRDIICTSQIQRLQRRQFSNCKHLT